MSEHLKAIEGLLTDCSRDTGHRGWEVFTDWVAALAISLANATEPHPAQRQKREEEYERILAKHGRASLDRFRTALERLVKELEREPGDALGRLYMQMELGNDHTGQYFSPNEVGQLTAALTFDEEYAHQSVTERGYVTLSEPTCGAGGMIIAFAKRMRAVGLNPQKQLHVTAVDIDITAVHMAYIQLSLLGIPAVIVHGDVLRLEEWSHWCTTFHTLGLWDYRLQRDRRAATPEAEPSAPPPSQAEPRPARLEQGTLFAMNEDAA